MSSTNKTTNYELSQFVETDKPAWLTDYNGDMRKLDTALKAVSDVADGASGSISSLTDRMTAAEGDITTNANDIDALEARADALEAQAQSTAGTIAGIQTEQTAQNLGIEAATELGYNLARPYDSASTYNVGAYVLFQNTLYKCITAVATGEAFDPTKWLAIKATDEIASGGITILERNDNLIYVKAPIMQTGDSYTTIAGDRAVYKIGEYILLSVDYNYTVSFGGALSHEVKIPLTIDSSINVDHSQSIRAILQSNKELIDPSTRSAVDAYINSISINTNNQIYVTVASNSSAYSNKFLFISALFLIKTI